MKRLSILLLLWAPLALLAQDLSTSLIGDAVKKGVVLIRQDYQLLNEDDEPIDNKPGLDCYGRSYSCGVRLDGDRFLVTKDFVTPWSKESVAKSDKRHFEVSYSGFLSLEATDYEELDDGPDDAAEEVEKHLYTVDGSEDGGFTIDEEAGKKRGFAIWLKSKDALSNEKKPSGLTIDIAPFNITTKEDVAVYDIPKQPSGNVVGGFFIVPRNSSIGTIQLRVNGMFEKRGGIWKLVSLGKEEHFD